MYFFFILFIHLNKFDILNLYFYIFFFLKKLTFQKIKYENIF